MQLQCRCYRPWRPPTRVRGSSRYLGLLTLLSLLRVYTSNIVDAAHNINVYSTAKRLGYPSSRPQLDAGMDTYTCRLSPGRTFEPRSNFSSLWTTLVSPVQDVGSNLVTMINQNEIGEIILQASREPCSIHWSLTH